MGLVTIIRGLALVVMIHYLWVYFESSICTRVALLKTTTNHLEIIGDISNVEDKLLLAASPVAGPYNCYSNDSMIHWNDSSIG